MDATGLLPIVLTMAIAVTCAALLTRGFGAPAVQGRFAAIDGLRGYLAFAVFLHHACIWYAYLRTGRWEMPASALYAHLGQSSVSLFFMITGFLFWRKVLDGRRHGIDWLRLYVSRALRLAPLYLFAMLGLLLVVLVLSGGERQVPVPALLWQAARWLTFTIAGTPDINGVKDTWLAVAGVTWTLRYEWLFYLCLPVLALSVGARPPATALGLALAGVAAVVVLRLSPVLMAPFAGGMFAAALQGVPAVARLARHRMASAAAALCLVAAVMCFPDPRHLGALGLLTAAFVLVAHGADLFGALTHRVSRLFGELAYGMYLLHGLLLFVTFQFVLGLPRTAALSGTAYWLLIAALTPALVFGTWATHRLIERPGMARVDELTAWLRRGSPRLSPKTAV
jgi:peptidoglycan/LPS O-acetylase OafA/YrhL